MTPSSPTTLPRRRLGKSGLEVSAIGLGCMGMSFAYGAADESESLRVLHRYVELGGNFLDTAECYSGWAPGNSGGPIADVEGNVIGVAAMIVSGLALAVPAPDLERLLSKAQ